MAQIQLNTYSKAVIVELTRVMSTSPSSRNIIFQDFVLSAKKKDGREYEPESLKAFVHSLERHLKVS